MSMFSAPSSIVMNHQDEHMLPPNTLKWLHKGKRRGHKKKRVSESFAAYFRRTLAS
jgi:hypothetical protein